MARAIPADQLYVGESMTVFEKIASGNLPSYKVWEDDEYLCILDINPVQEGHCLLFPKKCTDYIFDLGETTYGELWDRAKFLGKMLGEVFGKRIAVAVEGISVPHVLIHLVPVEREGDLDPCKARRATDEDLGKILEKIHNAPTSRWR
jgi:histidine triad (HIT) family protein